MRDFTRIRQYVSMTRIITGLIVAPFWVLLMCIIALSYQTPYSFDTFSSTVVSYLILISTLGSYFLALALILGTIVMLLLMNYYSCNISTCVIGAVMNAFLAAILFMIVLLITGSAFMPTLARSVLLLSLIAVPAMLAGILFWFIAVFKNTFLITYWKIEAS